MGNGKQPALNVRVTFPGEFLYFSEDITVIWLRLLKQIQPNLPLYFFTYDVQNGVYNLTLQYGRLRYLH